MPGADRPITDLGPQLRSVLLMSALWVVLVALIVGSGVWWFAARDRAAAGRIRATLFGSVPARGSEPRARKFLRISFGALWIVDGLLQAQPKMPGGFVSDVMAPAVSGSPQWYGDLVAPIVRAWTRHPIAADAATVWVQIGLGMLILLGGTGLVAKLSLWGSIAWSLAVWLLGEAFGGLLAPGASWLTGAPGAVLIYAAAAGLLLQRWDWWESGRAALIARRFAAAWIAGAAVLQALPFEQQWDAAGLSAPLVAGSRTAQPAFTAKPIAHLASAAAGHPAAVNATIIAILAVVAVALWVSGRGAVIVAGLLLCAATWWLGQDFGVLGGTATDPNTALPLGLLLACSLPAWSAVPATVRPGRPGRRDAPRLRTGVGAGLVTMAAGLTLVVPVVLVSTLGTAADAAAVAADSNGGLRQIPPRPAVDFTLADQRGVPVSTASLHGKLVLLTFLDPVCSSDCPLIANQLAIADREIGPLARQVEIVAIDTNPVFHYARDVDAFTRSHGLGGFANWHFLWGQPDTVQKVLDAYGISVGVPAVGMIQHSEGLYFITPDGRQAAYLDDGAAAQLTKTYAEQVREEIRSLLQ